jgi:hypothetical protein
LKNPEPRPAAVLSKAVLRAADQLAVPSVLLARILGLSEASVSRMRRGSFELAGDSKAFELGVLFVRLFRSLDALVGGDTASARKWFTADNTALGAAPNRLVVSIGGLVDVVAYLDARRAPV